MMVVVFFLILFYLFIYLFIYLFYFILLQNKLPFHSNCFQGNEIPNYFL